jgi:hypothetical protein
MGVSVNVSSALDHVEKYLKHTFFSLQKCEKEKKERFCVKKLLGESKNATY